MKRKKICLISSSGGHFEQLMMLKGLEKEYDLYIITEKTKYNKAENNMYLINQINREEKTFMIKMIIIFFQSLKIFLKEKPDMIISTGALSVIPTFLIGKFFRKKLVFIESFAKVSSPTLTGKFIYKFADEFIVQWEELLKIYPNALYLGSIY